MLRFYLIRAGITVCPPVGRSIAAMVEVADPVEIVRSTASPE